MPQAPSVAVPPRLPLVIQPENRDESTLKDAKLINGFVEKDALTGEYHVYKRPGLSVYGATIATAGRGVYNWRGNVYRIQGSTIYKDDVAIAGGAPNGALNTAGGVYHFSSTRGATPQLQFGNGAAAYNYDGGAGPITTIAGANFPSPAVKGWAYLDGTTYVMDAEAAIHGCDTLNDPIAWTDVLNVIEAQIEPDDGVALAKQLVYVIAFKQWSTEVFYDAQNALASPLGPVQGAKINMGCINSDSVQELDGALFWLAVNRKTSPQIMMLDNLKPQVISTKAIDRLIAHAAFGTIYSFAFKCNGHRYYAITLVTGNITLVYDVAERMWAQWTDVNGNYFPFVSATFTSTYDLILQHESDGKLYQIDPLLYTDNGSIITFDLYTPNFDAGNRRTKQLNMMWFIGDKSPGTVLQVRSNDSDYAADGWSNFRTVDMGQDDPFLENEGSFVRRAYHLRCQCNAPLRIQAIDLQLDLGTL
tara:strand:+ start:1720 stop:3144 length:1425 start_codon:yes stop_codon:yes gene_type:complete